MATVISFLALFVSVAAFLRAYLGARYSYVACYVEARERSGRVFLDTSLANESVVRRSVSWACLVISRRGTSFIEDLNAHSDRKKRIETTNDIICLKQNDRLDAGRTILIPLRFYYDEQVGIRDEKVTYSEVVDQDLAPGTYDARFFVFPKSRRHGLHRCTHCAFVVQPSVVG